MESLPPARYENIPPSNLSLPHGKITPFMTRHSLTACTFLVTALTLPSCGPVSRRDLSTIPQRQITYDDMCRLQSFFDQRNAPQSPPARTVDEQSTETERTEPDEHGRLRRVMIGEGLYVVTERSARRRFIQLLQEEYDRLPRELLDTHSPEIRVHVEWWASGQMRRLRPDREIEVTNQHGSVRLPFNPCIGEFLFGAPIYAMRRHFLDSDAARARGQIPPSPPDTIAPSESTVTDRPSTTASPPIMPTATPSDASTLTPPAAIIDAAVGD